MTDNQSQPSYFARKRAEFNDWNAERKANAADRKAERIARQQPGPYERAAAEREGRPVQTERKSSAAIIVGIVAALVIVVLLAVGSFVVGNLQTDVNNAIAKTDAKIKEATDKLASEKDATIADLRTQLDNAKKQPPAATPPATSTPDGNGGGGNTPSIDQRLNDLKFGPNQGWKQGPLTDAEWANIADNHPGEGVVGKSFAKTPAEAAEAAKNNPTVAGTYEQKANPANWVLVYNAACMSYGDDMAYQLPDGSFGYGDENTPDFVECGVAAWVNVVSGGAFRLLCDNGLKAAPVPTTKIASYPTPVTPITKLVPPTTTTPPTTTITYKYVERCDVTTKTTVTVTEEVAKDTNRYKPVGDIACQPPVIVKYVERCDVTTKTTVTVTEEVAKDTNRYKPVGDIACQPPVIVKYVERCDVTTKTTVTVTEEVAKDTNRYKPVGDIACQPPVEECIPPYVPNPDTHHPVKCLLKDPTKDPSETGNAPDNGTPMPDPGPATPPAVPEEEAPVVYEPPAPPAPVVTTPRPTEEIPVNQGEPATAPVEGTIDETTCAVCGGGMSDSAQAAPVAPAAAPAPAVAQPVAIPAVMEPAPAAATPAAAPAHVATSVASAPAQAELPVQSAVVAAVSDATPAG
jgi:hypothetical protein